MRTLTLAACAAALALTASAAHADPVTFNFSNAVFKSGGTISGSITIDTTTDKSTGANFTANGETFSSAAVSSTDKVSGSLFGNPASFVFKDTTGNYQVSLFFPSIGSFQGYTGGALCTSSSSTTQCGAAFLGAVLNDPSFFYGLASGVTDYLASGSLTLVQNTGSPTPASPASAATPEPSSIALLGTGLLSVAGTVRRRLRPTPTATA